MTKKTIAWQRTVECAVSNCVNYNEKKIQLDMVTSKLLEESIITYLVGYKGISKEEAQQFYSKCLDRALNRRRADGQPSPWYGTAACIGLIAGIANVFNFFASGFNLFFVLFFLISCSLAKMGNDHLSIERVAKKAVAAWKKKAQSDDVQVLIAALVEMEEIFVKAQK